LPNRCWSNPAPSPGRYETAAANGDVRDIAVDMTELTFDILSATLFSGHVAGTEEEFAGDIDRLLSTMGRVDPDGSAQGAALDAADPPDVRKRCSPSSGPSSRKPWPDRQKLMRDRSCRTCLRIFLTLLIRLAWTGRADN
jgi:hypothetical protein